MPNNEKLIVIDIIKLNHWLNARKITLPFIKKKIKSLANKLSIKKDFKINQKELDFINQ